MGPLSCVTALQTLFILALAMNTAQSNNLKYKLVVGEYSVFFIHL